MNDKRKDYINWDDYFMGIAILASQRSKDPSTQVGAVIVSPEKKIVSVGYNGFPKCGIADEYSPFTEKNKNNDDCFPWGKSSEKELENKYLYVVHAEPNAILNAGGSVKNCTMYLTWFPCADCAKFVVQSGIKELVYLHENTSDRYRTSMLAAKKMFNVAPVKYRKFTTESKQIVINFEAEA